VPWEISVALVEQTLAGLAAVHSRNVLHRDIKPTNILLTSDGVPKLADFGLAKHEEVVDATTTKRPLGTLRYLPPECLDGPSNDAAHDVYAMGLVLYELIVGEAAFDQRTVGELVLRISQGRYRPLDEACPTVWPEVVPLVETALAKEPSKRFPSAQAMREGCRKILDEVGQNDGGVSLTHYVTAPDRDLWLVEHRDRLSMCLKEKAQICRLEGRDVEAMERLSRIELLEPSRSPESSPATALGSREHDPVALVSAPDRMFDADGSPGLDVLPTEVSQRPANLDVTRASADSRTLASQVCALAFSVLSIPVCIHLVQSSSDQSGRLLAIPVLVVSLIVGCTAFCPSNENAHWVCLGGTLGGIGLSLLFPDDLMVSLPWVTNPRSWSFASRSMLSYFQPLLWTLTGLVTVVLVTVRSRTTGRFWTRIHFWWPLVLVPGTAIGLSVYASLSQENLNVRQVLSLPVAIDSKPLRLGLCCGFALPRRLEVQGYRPPVPPADLLRHYSHTGARMLVVGVCPALSSFVGRPGTTGSTAESDLFASTEDQELLTELSKWPGELVLQVTPRDLDFWASRSRADYFHAYAECVTTLARTTRAAAVELPGSSTLTWLSGRATTDLDTATLEPVERIARRIHSDLPRVKVGVLEVLDYGDPRRQSSARLVTQWAVQPWIDWVGISVRDVYGSGYALDQVVQGFRSTKTQTKMWLVTFAPWTCFARPPWKEGEDAAAIRIVGRYARSRGISTWIHSPGPTFAQYGWWYGWSCRPQSQATTPFEEFLHSAE